MKNLEWYCNTLFHLKIRNTEICIINKIWAHVLITLLVLYWYMIACFLVHTGKRTWSIWDVVHLYSNTKKLLKLAHVALMFVKFGKCSKHGNPLCLRISGSAHSGGTIFWIQNCILSVPKLYTFLLLSELITVHTLLRREQRWARWNRRESWNHLRSHLPANLLQPAPMISRDGFWRPQGAPENILILNI